MAELIVEGWVVESRRDLIQIRPIGNPYCTGISVIPTPHSGEVFPGDHVKVYEGGAIEVIAKGQPLPPNVREIELPSGSPQQDHS